MIKQAQRPKQAVFLTQFGGHELLTAEAVEVSLMQQRFLKFYNLDEAIDSCRSGLRYSSIIALIALFVPTHSLVNYLEAL